MLSVMSEFEIIQTITRDHRCGAMAFGWGLVMIVLVCRLITAIWRRWTHWSQRSI